MKRFANIRQTINELAQEQGSLKIQRKTVNFRGTRTVDPYQATVKALENKEKLRHLYVAYNILRGKEVIPFVKRPYNQNLVDKYVSDFKELEDKITNWLLD